MNDRRIALEVCLTSNVQTHAAESLDAHPVRRYFDRGLNVVLNTDNRLMSGTTLTDEYLLAARHHGFTFEELSTIALNGFASAFIPWKQRLRLLDRARVEIQRLCGMGPATATARRKLESQRAQRRPQRLPQRTTTRRLFQRLLRLQFSAAVSVTASVPSVIQAVTTRCAMSEAV